jgi:hypothetical protein
VEVKSGCREVLMEWEFINCALYWILLNIITIVKSRRMRLAGHIASRGNE